MRRALAYLMIVLPPSLRRFVGNHLLGWDIDRTAYIGRSLIVVGHLSMGPGSSIGPLNVIRHLDNLELGEGASIATRNWITGFPLGSEVFAHSPKRDPSVIMGKGAMITVGHDIDCCDRFVLGDYAGLVGSRSIVLTHNLDLVRDRFVSGPVEVEFHAIVMSGCTLLSGTRVPDRSIISANSVVSTKLTRNLTFYRGNPVEPVRALPESLKVFHRGETPDNQSLDPRLLPDS